MAMDFKKAAILGGGLLGGSVALALQRRFPGTPPALWMRSEESLRLARQRGLSGADCDLGGCLAGADLVILCTPAGAMPGVLAAAIEAGLSSEALVTDVGSVKAAVHRSLRPLIAAENISFIGSHPMAGSEKTGIAAASPDLFEGAACILTDDEGSGPAAVARLAAFWSALGCRVTELSAAEHDALVARVSHFPHAMAALTARVALEDPAAASFAGGGLRDTSRVAGGDPAMWAEIFIENRHALALALQRSLEETSEMLAMLQAADHEAVRGWLAGAKSSREHLSPVIPSESS